MELLGYDGLIRFERLQPEPIVVPASMVDKTNNWITIDNDDWTFGEQVVVVHGSGTISGFIHKDELDRARFHSTYLGAIENSESTRLTLSSVSTSKPVIVAAWPNSQQVTLLQSFLNTLSTLTVETYLRGWPATNASYKATAPTTQLKIQGGIKKWSLAQNASAADVSSIGSKFASFVKSGISGSGTFDFIINVETDQAFVEWDYMLSAVQIIEHGSVAKAAFTLKRITNSETFRPAIFYQCSILITACSIDTTFDDAIKGSASFVATGPIRIVTSMSHP